MTTGFASRQAPSWIGFFETLLFWAISPGSFGHFCNFVYSLIFWGGVLFEVGYYSKMGYYFFKICKNGALFEVGYYSKMGYYSSKYGKRQIVYLNSESRSTIQVDETIVDLVKYCLVVPPPSHSLSLTIDAYVFYC